MPFWWSSLGFGFLLFSWLIFSNNKKSVIVYHLKVIYATDFILVSVCVNRLDVYKRQIRNKPILILDEGTSAIDMQTAYDIENRLLKKEDLTLITITHHLEQNLLDKYNEIFYMENGRIKERGNFKHLINTSSCFSGYFHYNQKISGSS